jgi:hypothetical protein
MFLPGLPERFLTLNFAELEYHADTDHLHLIIWKDLLKPYGFDCDRDFFFKNISGACASCFIAPY